MDGGLDSDSEEINIEIGKTVNTQGYATSSRHLHTGSTTALGQGHITTYPGPTSHHPAVDLDSLEATAEIPVPPDKKKE